LYVCDPSAQPPIFLQRLGDDFCELGSNLRIKHGRWGGRAVGLGRSHWRLRGEADSRPFQHEHGAPADFLIEFGAASLECQPDAINQVLVGRLARALPTTLQHYCT